MERVILHADLNNFYASVECLHRPELRDKPVAVAGDPQSRRGIVLAKNQLAKRCGVATGEPLWQAKQKCPDIIFVPPNFSLYHLYSHAVRDIYRNYTDLVEPFGLDECWLDVTGSTHLFGDGKTIADRLRHQVERELGLTISVGVSFNKIFAKLGSDLKKPNATTVLSKDNFRQRVWPLPASDLLFVGRSTTAKLERYGICTIGDLANCKVEFLTYLLGKNGEMLWRFANGLDRSPMSGEGIPMQSIGNSTTASRDLKTDDDVKVVLTALCQQVSSRMRKANVVCHTVQLFVRDNRLEHYEHQGSLSYPNRTAKKLLEKSLDLFCSHRPNRPVRALGVRACQLERTPPQEQISFLPELSAIHRQESLEQAVDDLRGRFGNGSVRCGLLLCDHDLKAYRPQESPFSQTVIDRRS